MYLQTSSQANIVSRPHTLPMSVWYDFHWHHLLRNRCMKPRGNIPSIPIQSSASNSPRAVHSSLRLPCLWEQPKCATDTELITTNLVQCAYPRTTRSSAALQKSRPSESWMWLGTKDVALKICSSYSEFKELTQKNIFSLIGQFMVSHKLIQCSKSKI